MSQALDIAVVGASGLVGGAVIEQLAQRDFPVGQLFPLASAESEGNTVQFGKRHLSVHDLATFDFAKVALAFFCVPEDVAREHIPRATAAGCIVIDQSPVYRLDPEVPLVIPQCNAQAIGDYLLKRIIASPDSSIIHILLALLPLHHSARLERINAVALRAVSEIGKAGIDELSGQSIAMFNLKPIEQQQFSQQIAFNVLPEAGGKGMLAGMRLETQLQEEFQKILQDPDIQMNATALQVPVFFGHSHVLHVEFQEEIATQTACQALRDGGLVNLVQAEEEAEFASAVNDAANDDQIFVSRVREDRTWPRGLDLWVVADNIRCAANNSVNIAEILVKDYL